MIGFRHILCPVDFSDTSRRALRQAVVLAARYDARLTVLHVRPAAAEYVLPAAGIGEPAIVPADLPSHDQVESALAHVLDEVGRPAQPPVLAVDTGRAHAAIVARATTEPTDLIVLGTHGRSGVNRLLLGSVTEKVLRTAPCPVLTVPPGEEGAPHALFREILCPTDFSPSSQRAVATALDLARQAGGRATVLHAIEYLEPEEPCEHVDFDIRAYRAHLLEHFRERLHAAVAAESCEGCAVTEVLAINRAYREILDRAAALSADLIVMGVRGHGAVELVLYGSNTQQVVRHATCPVLTVRA